MGIAKARVLVTVLADDAANVFIIRTAGDTFMIVTLRRQDKTVIENPDRNIVLQPGDIADMRQIFRSLSGLMR